MLPSTLIRRTLGLDSPLAMIDGELGRSFNRLWQEAQPMDHVGVYPVDIREDANHLYVEAEMPGFSKDQITVTLEKGVLHIAAQREQSQPATGDDQPANGQAGDKADCHVTRHLSERRYTRIARSFSLPNTVDENKVDARLEHGVLHLTLHKREEVRPRRIEVK